MLPNRSRLSVLDLPRPPLLLYAVAVLLPILQSLFLSFFQWDGVTDMQFVGLGNYVYMLTGDTVFWTAFLNTLGYLVICLILQLGGALLVASLLTMLRRGRELVKTLYLLPAVISTVAIAFLFQRIYSLEPAGLLNRALELDRPGRPADRLALRRRHRARGRVGARGLALHRPLHAHHLRRAPRRAAASSRKQPSSTAPRGGRSSGGSSFRTSARSGSRRPSSPRPIALRGFDIPYLLTNGGPGQASELLTTYMYKTAFTSTDYGYASTIAVFVVIECLVAVGLILLLLRRKADA